MSKEIKKVLFKNLDEIYKSCKKVSRDYGIKYASNVYLGKVIEIIKSNKVDKKDIEAFNIQKAFFDIYDQILKTCKVQAREIGSDGVSFDFLKGVIKVVKNNYAREAA
jgi:hypothetical protein